MKLTQHGQNLWQLTRLIAFNCYLVAEDDGLTLIDTNMDGSGQAILQAAQTIGRPITRITLTHAHGDHVGCWMRWRRCCRTPKWPLRRARPNFSRVN